MRCWTTAERVARHRAKKAAGEIKQASLMTDGRTTCSVSRENSDLARSIGGMLFECAICPAIAMLMFVGLVGLLVVVRIQPF
jgi:hypothetical protein